MKMYYLYDLREKQYLMEFDSDKKAEYSEQEVKDFAIDYIFMELINDNVSYKAIEKREGKKPLKLLANSIGYEIEEVI